MIMGQKLDINYEDYCIERVCFRLQTSDFRLQTSDFGPQTSDFGLQTLDVRFLLVLPFLMSIFRQWIMKELKEIV